MHATIEGGTEPYLRTAWRNGENWYDQPVFFINCGLGHNETISKVEDNKSSPICRSLCIKREWRCVEGWRIELCGRCSLSLWPRVHPACI